MGRKKQKPKTKVKACELDANYFLDWAEEIKEAFVPGTEKHHARTVLLYGFATLVDSLEALGTAVADLQGSVDEILEKIDGSSTGK